MNLTALQPGDVVAINHKGRTCEATVLEVLPRELRVEPHATTFTWRRVGAREVQKRVKRAGETTP